MLATWIGCFALRLLLTVLSAFVLMLILGKPMIKWLQLAQIGQVIRTTGPESHFSKKGTPTMGGILIIIAITLSSLLFGNWHNPLLHLGLITLWLFGGIGFWDDYKKLILKHHHGLAARYKYLWQSVFALFLAFWFYHYLPPSPLASAIFLPFSGYLPLGILIVPLIYFTLTGSSNAVNLTDGLDGLATMCIMGVALGLGVLALLEAQVLPAHMLMPVSGALDLGILAAAIIGAGLGFLWFNTFPAQVFMGDVGALGLGALLGFIAIALQMELILVIMGGIFVIETLSVMVQVSSFKLRKKRVFKMAPIHHHFELSGWPESRISMRFAIITVILVLIGILSVLI
jgi:phospho-N-acetylmuramoyl-pentapeptide-transferase